MIISGPGGLSTLCGGYWPAMRITLIGNMEDPDMEGRRGGVAVGTPVTQRPPHRSVLEELPHTALALGDDPE